MKTKKHAKWEHNMQDFHHSISYGPVSSLSFSTGSSTSDYLSHLIQLSSNDLRLAKRVRVISTELLQNAIQHAEQADSDVHINLMVVNNQVKISVSNTIGKETAEKVNSKIQEIMNSEDIKQFLRKTMDERKKQELRGGIGLIRMRSENNAVLESSWKKDILTVTATI
jgi:hypothetical protein